MSHHARIEVIAAGEGHKLFSSPSPPNEISDLAAFDTWRSKLIFSEGKKICHFL